MERELLILAISDLLESCDDLELLYLLQSLLIQNNYSFVN